MTRLHVVKGARWISGRALDSGARGPMFDPRVVFLEQDTLRLMCGHFEFFFSPGQENTLHAQKCLYTTFWLFHL